MGFCCCCCCCFVPAKGSFARPFQPSMPLPQLPPAASSSSITATIKLHPMRPWWRWSRCLVVLCRRVVLLSLLFVVVVSDDDLHGACPLSVSVALNEWLRKGGHTNKTRKLTPKSIKLCFRIVLTLLQQEHARTPGKYSRRLGLHDESPHSHIFGTFSHEFRVLPRK